MRKILLCIAGALGLASLTVPVQAAERTLVLGGGEVAGVFYPEAGAICRVVNKERAASGLRCLVEPSTGSTANLAALESGDQQLALVQSKLLAEAVAGTGPFEKHPHPELRSLFSLHGEAVAVVVGPEAKIKSLADLKGKRVSLGRSGSFQHAMSDAVLSAAGLKAAELGAALEMDPEQQVKALCNNEVDAAIFTGLSPISEVQEALDDCGADLLPVKGGSVDAFVKANPAFSHLRIGEDDYQGLKDDVPTIGLRGVLVTTSKMSDQDAEMVVKAVFQNLGPFKSLHPMLSGLEKKQMARDSLAAPLHEGAAKYYRENGLP